MATLVAKYCSKSDQLKNVQGLECNAFKKLRVKETEKKSVAMATLVARYCHKAYQLKSLQEFQIQSTDKNIKPANRKVLPWQHLLPGTAKKIISSNQCKVSNANNPEKF